MWLILIRIPMKENELNKLRKPSETNEPKANSKPGIISELKV